MPQKVKEHGMSYIKKLFNEIYSDEEKALEKVKTLGSDHIVRPLFQSLVALKRIYDGLHLQCHYYGKYENGDIRGFVLEYCEGVELYKHMHMQGRFSEWDIQELMRYVFST